MAWDKRFRLLAALLVLLAATPARAEVVDGVVAAIGGKALPLSILRAYVAAFEPEQPPAVALEHLIDDRLLAGQARRYGQVSPPDELAKARAAHPVPAGLTEPEWHQVIDDHVLARHFLEFRFGDFVPVSREQEQAYYNANRPAFPEPFAQAEPRIHALLVPVARGKREQDFKRDLRTHADVRIEADLLDAVGRAR